MSRGSSRPLCALALACALSGAAAALALAGEPVDSAAPPASSSAPPTAPVETPATDCPAPPAPPGGAPGDAPARPVLPLTDVRIDADLGIPTEQIRRALPVQLGAPLAGDAVVAVTKFLASLPIIRCAQVSVEDAPDGEVLVLHLERQLVVRDIAFDGIFPVFERDALKALRIRAGDAFDPGQLEAEAERVAQLMEQSGFEGSTCSGAAVDDEGEISVTYTCHRGDLSRVGAITVTGATAIPAAEIESELRPWLFFTTNRLKERVEALKTRYHELGYVRVRIKAVPGAVDDDGHVPLTVTIDEGKQLVVEIVGAENLSIGDLAEVLPFAREGGYGTFLVEEGAEAIRDLYEASGFPHVEVAKERIEGAERVTVRYAIREGDAEPLAAVCIDDPEALPPQRESEPDVCRTIVRRPPPTAAASADAASAEAAADAPFPLTPQDALRSGRARWLVLAPRWQSTVLEEDRGALVDYYQSVGYADVVVAAPRMEEIADGVVAVFAVDRGPEYRITDVAIEGSRVDVAEVVEANLSLKPNSVYRDGDVEGVATALEKELQSLGYLGARVTGDTELVAPPATKDAAAAARGRARVHFRVDPGPLYRVTDVVLLGSSHTQKNVVRRAFALEPGALLTPAALADTQKNVRALEVFDAIQVAPIGLDAVGAQGAATEPIDVPVKVQVRERPRTELDLGFGYDTDRGASGKFTYRELNLFDRAKKLTLSGVYGERDKGASAVLSDPRLFGSSVKGAVSSAYADSDLEAFDEESFKVGGTLSRELPWHLTSAIELAYEFSDISNVVADDPDAPEAGVTHELVLTPSLAYDTRNDLLYPTAGSFASVAVGLSSRAFLSDDNFVRYDVQGRRYQTLFDGVVGVVSGRFTDVDLYGSTSTVPTPELLFTGGTSTVRGFAEDRIGPLDANGKPLGGGSRIVANFELRFPLVWLLEGAVFCDAGQVARQLSGVSFDDFQIGAGGGLRLRSPVGPLRIDLGYPVVPGDASEQLRIHFSFGYPF